jgi:hypothetical protein
MAILQDSDKGNPYDPQLIAGNEMILTPLSTPHIGAKTLQRGIICGIQTGQLPVVVRVDVPFVMILETS